MARIQPIVDAIADLLDAIDGLTVYKEPPGTVDSPAVAVSLGPGQYDTTMARGTDDMTFMLDVFTSASSPQGMENLYGYLDGSGAESIVTKFGTDPELGGVVEFVEVTGWDKPNRVEVGGGEFYHVEITVNVGARGLS